MDQITKIEKKINSILEEKTGEAVRKDIAEKIREIPKGISNGGVEIILGGDSELVTIRDACEFIVYALDKLIAQQVEKREKNRKRLESHDDDDD